jgi:hypothetical protein
MPFDGNCPLDFLSLDLSKPAGKPALRVRPKAVPAPTKQPTDIARARRSVLILEILEELFGSGANWLKHGFHDHMGRHCLVGALRHVRGNRTQSDDACVYLRQAIAASYGKPMTIVGFNDSRKSYAEVHAVICLAREMAQRVANGYAATLSGVCQRH